MTFTQLAGVLPAIVFPAATLGQFVRLWRQRSAAGVSVSTWTLFGLANLAIYVYAERYTEWQSIVGMLVTAILDFAIAGLALAWARHGRAASGLNSRPLAIGARAGGGSPCA